MKLYDNTYFEEDDHEGRNPLFAPGWWIVPLVFVSAVILGVLIGTSAFAQSAAKSKSASASNSDSVSVAQAGSYSASQGGSVNIAADPANTKAAVSYGGSYDVRNVPSVGAPGIITAFNCAQGISAGGSWLGGGIALGGTYTDKNCERLSQAGALQVVAGNRAAIIHLASGSPEMCKSLRAAGVLAANQPCGDKERLVAAPRVTTSSKSNKAPFSKCVLDGNKVTFKKASGFSSAVAKQACLQYLGY